MSAVPRPLGSPGTRYAILPNRRDCPRCWRPGTLEGVFGGKKPLECVGCGALFWHELAFGEQPEALVQTSPPVPVRMLEFAPEEEQANAGARLADDFRCPVCHAPGFQFRCANCERTFAREASR